MMIPRIITIIVGLPVMLLVIYWGGIPFIVFVTAAVLLGLREYFQIVKRGGYQASAVLGQVCGLALLGSMYLNTIALAAPGSNQGTAVVISVMLLTLCAAELFRSDVSYALLRIGVTVLGVFLIAWTLGHLLLIRDIRPGGMRYTFFLCAVIWAVDTAAYLTGLAVGRHPLAPRISPKKTVEGLAGGLFFGTLTAIVFARVSLANEMSLAEAAIVGMAIAVVAQLSDLIESLTKRSAGVKDSSGILPGHGGVLDRFDSFMFTAPFFFYYLSIFH